MSNYPVQITSDERTLLLKALDAARNEYYDAAGSISSKRLSEEMREVGHSFSRLHDKFAMLRTKDEMRPEAERIIRTGNMINAIKYVRASSYMSLIEAKKYCEELRDAMKAAGTL